MAESEIDQLRREIAEIAGKIRMAYGHADMDSFHLYLGMMYSLTARLYEANAKAEAEYICECLDGGHERYDKPGICMCGGLIQ